MRNFKITDFPQFVFTTNMGIRISDINYGNHLGHDSLVSFFHEARVRFLKKIGYGELDINGLGILVTNLVVNYVNEAFYSDVITIKIGIGEIKKSSIDLIYQAIIEDTNSEIARAITTVTFYDYKNLKVARIPKIFLSSIKEN